MNRRGVLLLIGAIIVAVLITWLNSYWITYKGLQFTEKVKKIDYYLSDFTLLNTESDGNMRYLVKGQYLIHQESTGASEIFNPLLQARNSDNTIISLESKKARQEKRNGPIQLLGKVSIVKNSNKTSKGFQLHTSNLLYNPLEKKVSSNTKVVLDSDFGTLQGIGFSSKLDEQELRIHSNVQAELKPEN